MVEVEGDFDRFAMEVFPLLVRLTFLITGDGEEARDIAQEALARAYARWSSVGGMERPDRWAAKVATNLAISHERRRRTLSRLPVPRRREVQGPEPPESPLMAALRSLSPNQRAVLVLRYFADWSIEDVATELGKRPGTVRALTSQGLERMRKLLAEVEHEA
jgi:RNA polymerase sigma factor (sigma-70 family)